MFINREMSKEDVAHTCNGVLFSHKKEWKYPVVATWTDPAIVIVSEVIENDNYHMISLLFVI